MKYSSSQKWALWQSIFKFIQTDVIGPSERALRPAPHHHHAANLLGLPCAPM